MPAEVQPPELARLLDFAERPRLRDWSLRAALTRYAQPQPERAARVLELVRRTEGALQTHGERYFLREGPAVWAAFSDDAPPPEGVEAEVIGLLWAAAELDQLGERLAAWAVDRPGDRPDREVDEAVADVGARLDGLGVPREERTRPPRRRG